LSAPRYWGIKKGTIGVVPDKFNDKVMKAKVARGGQFNKPEHPPEKGTYLLDTLGQLGNPCESRVSESLNKFHKKARRKAIGRPKAVALYHAAKEVNSPLRRAYGRSIDCVEILIQEGDTVRGKYCKARWCPVCGANYAGQAINAYKPAIEAIGQLYFVTLTIPSVKAERLREAIRGVNKTFKHIRHDIMRPKFKTQFKGVRKIECNYNSEADTYNPHIHFLVGNTTPCECLLLLALWMQQNEGTLPDAQSIEKVTDADKDKHLTEVFKYSVKDVTKDEQFIPAAHDKIYQAMYKMRVFDRVGIKKAPIDESNRMKTQIDFQPSQNEVWGYDYKSHDWTTSKGQVFTGYSPTLEDLTIIGKMNNPL